VLRHSRMALGVGRGILGIAREQKDFPAKLKGGVIGITAATTRRNQFQDMTMPVLGARIGRIHLIWLAFRVVRKCGVYASIHRIRFDLFRAIHRRGPEKICCSPGFDQDIGLAVEPILRRQRAASPHERQPDELSPFLLKSAIGKK
jgi:hypothetical protein